MRSYVIIAHFFQSDLCVCVLCVCVLGGGISKGKYRETSGDKSYVGLTFSSRVLYFSWYAGGKGGC